MSKYQPYDDFDFSTVGSDAGATLLVRNGTGVIRANPGAQKVLGYTEAQLIERGDTAIQLFNVADRWHVAESVQALLGGAPFYRATLGYMHPEHGRIPVFFLAVPFPGADNVTVVSVVPMHTNQTDIATSTRTDRVEAIADVLSLPVLLFECSDVGQELAAVKPSDVRLVWANPIAGEVFKAEAGDSIRSVFLARSDANEDARHMFQGLRGEGFSALSKIDMPAAHPHASAVSYRRVALTAGSGFVAIFCAPGEVPAGAISELYSTMIEDATASLDAERSSLAMALHDHPVQEMSVASTKLHQAQRSLSKGQWDRASELVRESSEAVMFASGSLRDVMSQIEPLVFDPGNLEGALETFGDNIFGDDASVTFETRCVGDMSSLPAAIEDALASVANEALLNAKKHAEATAITVRLEVDTDQVRLSVTDDGKGFDPAVARKTGHMGLRSFPFRVQAVNGAVHVESSHEGTTLTCDVPLGPASDSFVSGSDNFGLAQAATAAAKMRSDLTRANQTIANAEASSANAWSRVVACVSMPDALRQLGDDLDSAGPDVARLIAEHLNGSIAIRWVTQDGTALGPVGGWHSDRVTKTFEEAKVSSRLLTEPGFHQVAFDTKSPTLVPPSTTAFHELIDQFSDTSGRSGFRPRTVNGLIVPLWLGREVVGTLAAARWVGSAAFDIADVAWSTAVGQSIAFHLHSLGLIRLPNLYKEDVS